MSNTKKQVEKNPVAVGVVLLMALAIVWILWNSLVKAFNYVVSSLRGASSKLSKDEAQAIASAIYNEVNKVFTDEDNIMTLIVGLSLADYHKVKAEFGVQPYSNTFDNFDTLTGRDSNLTEVLNQTLNDEQKQQIRNQNPYIPIN
ncbi:MAG: hypothetical protein RH981_18945 [Arenibacter sp.]